jgi:PiT family inorganic phosphate transporter
MVRTELVTLHVVLSGVIAAIAWTWLATKWGLPISVSHALIGGYGGAAMVHVGLTSGWSSATSALVPGGWTTTILFIVVAPALGALGGSSLMVAVLWAFRKSRPRSVDGYFRKLQLVSAAIFSFAHGTNDAQKTMGIITGALVAGGYLDTFEVPLWVILSAHGAIALGTLFGGWRVIRTMGDRITKLKPAGGFCAETGGALSVLTAAWLGAPASTTHTIAGAIAGVGAIQRVRAVRWGNVRSILWAWVLTIPATLVAGAIVYLAMRLSIAAL